MLVARIIGDVAFLLQVAAFGLCLEIFWPREKVSIRDRVNGFLFWPFFLTFQAAIAVPFAMIMKKIGFVPFYSVAWMPLGFQVLLAVLVGDFIYYWYHRAQHRFLWRFHSVHHSIEHISSVNTYHHWLEPLFNMLLVSVPAYFIGIRPTGTIFAVAWLVRAQTYLVHSPTRLHYGPLSKVLLDNRFHRIHHSLESRHFEKNFGMLTPLWDVLFGTAYWPKNEWPKVGLAGNPEPRSLRQWFAWRLAGDAADDARLQNGEARIAVPSLRP